MKKLCAASIAALLVATGGAAFAQSETDAKIKLSQAECQNIWNRADAAGKGSLSAAEADSYVSNFAAADTDSDGSLSSSEFMAACDQGLVSDSAATGAGEGAAGSETPSAPSAPGAGGGAGAPSDY